MVIQDKHLQLVSIAKIKKLADSNDIISSEVKSFLKLSHLCETSKQRFVLLEECSKFIQSIYN